MFCTRNCKPFFFLVTGILASQKQSFERNCSGLEKHFPDLNCCVKIRAALSHTRPMLHKRSTSRDFSVFPFQELPPFFCLPFLVVSWSLFPKIAVSGEYFEIAVLCGTLKYIFLSNLFLVIFPELNHPLRCLRCGAAQLNCGSHLPWDF